MTQEVRHQNFYTLTKSADPDKADIPSVKLTSIRQPITLRSLLPSDVPILTAILSKPENTQDDLSVSKLSPAEISDVVRSWLTISSPPERLNFLILSSDSNTPIGISGLGWIGLHDTRDESAGRAAAAGVVLNAEERRKGYGYEALRMSVDYGLRELGLREVRIGTPSSNLGMRAIMERRFEMLPEKRESGMQDRFGNDLQWRIGREWLSKEHS